MASLRHLQSKVKTFQDFQKVVNIQKIVVMKEIMIWKKKIEQATFRRALFTNNLLEINQRFSIFDPSVFDLKKSRTPIERDLFFILPSPASDRLGDYANKLILEFIKKNNKPEDLYVIVGSGLEDEMSDEGLKVIKVMNGALIEDPDTYSRIAFQILRGHADMLFQKAGFIYLNGIEKRVISEPVFPFTSVKTEFSEEDKAKFTDDMKIIMNTNLKRVSFYKNVEKVGVTLLNQAINMQIYTSMVQYRLALCMRELQSLDDKEKNIKTEIEVIKLKMQRVRKDNITNELLVNAVAFGTLSKKDEDEVEAA